MANRNVDKGREAENAVAELLRLHGMEQAERRSKRGGTVEVDCPCGGDGFCPCVNGRREVPADAGDITGVHELVVQVKWSGYAPLAEDMRRTDEQRRVAGARTGLLVRKRKGVGCARAGEWDAYLPAGQVAELLEAGEPMPASWEHWPIHMPLEAAAELLAHAGYR